MPIMENEVYTLQEIAKELKVSEITVRRWVRAGKIPHAQIGRQYRFWGADILEQFGRDSARKPQAQA